MYQGHSNGSMLAPQGNLNVPFASNRQDYMRQPNEGWENYSVHSSSGVGSECHGSEASLHPGGQDDQSHFSITHSMSFPDASDTDDVVTAKQEVSTRRFGFGSSFFSGR